MDLEQTFQHLKDRVESITPVSSTVIIPIRKDGGVSWVSIMAYVILFCMMLVVLLSNKPSIIMGVDELTNETWVCPYRVFSFTLLFTFLIIVSIQMLRTKYMKDT